MSADAVFGYAPGKVILFGEHAVVYGQPAVAATLDRGIRVAVTERDNDDGPLLRTSGSDLPPRARPDPEGEGPERIRRALAMLVELCGERTRRLVLSAEGAIPAGAGLGSSAALSIAMIRGARQLFGEPPLPLDALVERAFVLERVFHGNPSGIDHTVIATGGCLRYQKGPDERRARFDPIALPRRVRLAVAVAGPHAGTATAVAALQERRKRHPAHYQRIAEAIGAIARDGCLALESGAYGAVGELMDLNQGLLNALGVSSPAIESLCAIARERGALGAKLTGAGGGGAVIALVDDDPAPVIRAFEAAGFPAFAATLESSPQESR